MGRDGGPPHARGLGADGDAGRHRRARGRDRRVRQRPAERDAGGPACRGAPGPRGGRGARGARRRHLHRRSRG